MHRLNRDEKGRVKCVACYMCSTACPAHCIDIVAAPSPWPDREKYPEMFVIDELRCIYCGMCEQACPCDAIELTSLFDLTGLSREEMMFDKEKLLSVFDQTVPMGKDPVRTSSGQARASPRNRMCESRRAPTMSAAIGGVRLISTPRNALRRPVGLHELGLLPDVVLLLFAETAAREGLVPFLREYWLLLLPPLLGFAAHLPAAAAGAADRGRPVGGVLAAVALVLGAAVPDPQRDRARGNAPLLCLRRHRHRRRRA